MDVAFDSLPFGACNTMQDLVALRVPTISLAHDGEFEPGTRTRLRWRTTIAASMLTRLGLSGLVALEEGDFFAKASHLLANPWLRAAWRIRMAAAPADDLSRAD
jgi:predicted O-linked N-acetylglucosamine transferase (SPINDLY family)